MKSNATSTVRGFPNRNPYTPMEQSRWLSRVLLVYCLGAPTTLCPLTLRHDKTTPESWLMGDKRRRGMCTEAKAPSDWASDYTSSPKSNAMVSAPSAIDYPFGIVVSFTLFFKRPLSWLIAVKNTPNFNGLGIIGMCVVLLSDFVERSCRCNQA